MLPRYELVIMTIQDNEVVPASVFLKMIAEYRFYRIHLGCLNPLYHKLRRIPKGSYHKAFGVETVWVGGWFACGSKL